jgi:hypothetical protein
VEEHVVDLDADHGLRDAPRLPRQLEQLGIGRDPAPTVDADGLAAARMRAIEGARLPVLKASYEDAELLEKVPLVGLGKEALVNARPRPVSPYYADMSLRMAEWFSSVLKGDTPPEEAVKTLQGELEDIVRQGKESGA